MSGGCVPDRITFAEILEWERTSCSGDRKEACVPGAVTDGEHASVR